MILVSACLAGRPCRWNGEAKTVAGIVDLVAHGKAIPVCPEELGGLPTPREPSEIRGDRVFSREGRELTEEFRIGAKLVLDIARSNHCTLAILKSRSPSCGSGQVHDGSFSGRLVPGDGIAARLLKAHGLRVLTEDDPGLGDLAQGLLGGGT